MLLVDVAGTADTSLTVMDVFIETDHTLAQQGIDLWVTSMPTGARWKRARRTPAWQRWADAGKLYATLNQAVDAYERRA